MSYINLHWDGVQVAAMILPSGLRVKLKKITASDMGIVDEPRPDLIKRTPWGVDIVALAGKLAGVEYLLNEVVRFSLLEPAIGRASGRRSHHVGGTLPPG